MWGRATRSLYPIYVKKQPIRLAVFTKMRIFAVALSYGVMVAQQVLVMFVVVRIRLGQRLRRLYRLLFCFSTFHCNIYYRGLPYTTNQNIVTCVMLKRI